MSFSSSVKNQLSRIENNICCSLAEMAGIVATTGVVEYKQGVTLKLLTENSAMARRFFAAFKAFFKFSPDIKLRKNSRLKKRAYYLIYITSDSAVADIMKRLGLEYSFPEGQENAEITGGRQLDKLIQDECCKRAFLRGTFLAGGSVSNPEKTYHLEINVRYKKMAQKISKIINSYDLNSKVILRKGSYVVYLKEGENIVDFLNVIGAHKQLLELENIRIIKQMRNNVNRIVNCETANLDKTVNASVKQLEYIKLLEEDPGLGNIPAPLQEIARLRIQHPDASLKELGQMMKPPLGKSGVNHRLNKIEKLAVERQGLVFKTEGKGKIT
ncbi:MAG: DNA-binding protein WhiA [Eubacteriales bacterium]|nr:DNA-binding protein WhiA [Eubacteriales bacterium]